MAKAKPTNLKVENNMKNEAAGKAVGIKPAPITKVEKKKDFYVAEKGSVADRTLKLYCNEEYLYIGKFGDTFSLGTNKKYLGEAKKYKNSYYKK